MKRLLALFFCLCLMLSLTACGNRNKTEEKDNKTYLVTLQKTMQADEVTNSASFVYDEKGRPQLIEVKMGSDRGMAAELVYDSYGHKIAELFTNIHGTNKTQSEIHYDLTYADGKITHCDMSVSTGSKINTMGFDLRYDAGGRLVLLSYDNAYTAHRLGVWHSFDYDANGRLIRETLCQKMVSASIVAGGDTYRLSQCRYDYSADGKVMNFSVYIAESTEPVSQDGLDGLTFLPTPDAYAFCFDDAGKLLYVGSGPDDVYEAGDETIYENSSYNFDKNGNLLSTVQNGTGNTYGYTGFDLTQEEAEMAKRLQHGISEYLAAHMMFARMDPVYCEIGPVILYAPMLQNPVYYLVPYPMWGTV